MIKNDGAKHSKSFKVISDFQADYSLVAESDIHDFSTYSEGTDAYKLIDDLAKILTKKGIYAGDLEGEVSLDGGQLEVVVFGNKLKVYVNDWDFHWDPEFMNKAELIEAVRASRFYHVPEEVILNKKVKRANDKVRRNEARLASLEEELKDTKEDLQKDQKRLENLKKKQLANKKAKQGKKK